MGSAILIVVSAGMCPALSTKTCSFSAFTISRANDTARSGLFELVLMYQPSTPVSGFERLGDHVALAVNLAPGVRDLGVVRQLAVERRGHVEEQAGARFLAEAVVRRDEEVRPAAAGGLELELLEQVVELDVLDRQLEAGVRRDDLVGHDLEGLGLAPSTRA